MFTLISVLMLIGYAIIGFGWVQVAEELQPQTPVEKFSNWLIWPISLLGAALIFSHFRSRGR